MIEFQNNNFNIIYVDEFGIGTKELIRKGWGYIGQNLIKSIEITNKNTSVIMSFSLKGIITM